VPLKDLASIGEKFFAMLGVDKEADPLKAARALPTAKILEAQVILDKELNKDNFGLWDAAIDQQFLADHPKNIFSAGKQNPVPVIAGTTLGELTGSGMFVMPVLVPNSADMLKGVKKIGQKGYACIFDQVPGKWKQESCVSFHSLDLTYLFGYMSTDQVSSDRNYTLSRGLYSKLAGAKARTRGTQGPMLGSVR
jgi:carboxylesterase type B